MVQTMRVDMGGGRERILPVNYPSNARSEKNESEGTKKEPIEKVTTGAVSRRKKGLADRLGESVISEDAHGVGRYIVTEVLLPAAKNMISEAITEGINRILFGESRTRTPGTRPGYTSYNRVRTTAPTEHRPRDLSPRGRATHDFDEIVLSSRDEAEEVLDRLRDLIEKYEVATVSDLYDLVGITGSFTDDRWGWYNLKDASWKRVREGFLLVLPRTDPLD